MHAPLVTVQTSMRNSNSSHVLRNRDSSTLAMACEILCRKDCGLSHIPICISRMEGGPGI
jgi:hypothetical protein